MRFLISRQQWVSVRQLRGIDLRLLASFEAVVLDGSVSTAASRLCIAQSALSRAVQTLELRLGVPLVHRTSRGVDVTAEGSLLLPLAADLLDRHSEMLAAFDGLRVR